MGRLGYVNHSRQGPGRDKFDNPKFSWGIARVRATRGGSRLMAYVATGTAGNDTLNQSTDTGPGTVVGLAGDDCILQGTGSATITGDSGNDIVVTQAGNTGTIDGGTENDSVFAGGNSGAMVLLMGAGADTVNF